jgi:hypothetical protein
MDKYVCGNEKPLAATRWPLAGGRMGSAAPIWLPSFLCEASILLQRGRSFLLLARDQQL